jgi:hypothetical protein
MLMVETFFAGKKCQTDLSTTYDRVPTPEG